MWVFTGSHRTHALDRIVVFVNDTSREVSIDCGVPIRLVGDAKLLHFHVVFAFQNMGRPDKIAEIYEGEELIGVLTTSVEEFQGVDMNTAILLRLWMGEPERIRGVEWPARSTEHLMREELACLGEIVLALKDGTFTFIDDEAKLGCFVQRKD